MNRTEEKEPYVIFNALKACCDTNSIELKSKAVDLFAKLFDYTQFDDTLEKKLTDDSVNVISSCFEGEGTDPELELQVVRALMHSILLMPCHGASLLQAVRQIYNVFIFSLTARNQAIAQGILTQVIGAIFSRVEESRKSRSQSTNASKLNFESIENVNLPDDKEEERLTLSQLERINDSLNDNDRVNEANSATEDDQDLEVKDAFWYLELCVSSLSKL